MMHQPTPLSLPILFGILLVLSGCAIGVIREDRMYGIAFGVSKIERCRFQPLPSPTPDTHWHLFTPPQPVAQREECYLIEGGSLSAGILGFFGAIIDGVVAYFTLGG